MEETNSAVLRGYFDISLDEGNDLTCKDVLIKMRAKDTRKSGASSINGASLFVGKIEVLPNRIDELPEFWYFCNGDNFALSSPQGKALASLSANFKADWGIEVLDGKISLPNLFMDGNGYFFRAVNGTDRVVGDKQEDAIRNMTGIFNNKSADVQGAFYQTGQTVGGWVRGGGSTDTYITFDASRVVPVAEENRPINVGMTPAIYLGA